MGIAARAACSPRPAANFRWAGRRSTTLCGFIWLSGSQADLNSPNALHQFGPEHFGQQRAARLPVAVLAGKRAAVADHQIGGALDEFAVVANAVFAFADRS